MISLSFVLTLFVKGAATTVFIYYVVTAFSPKNEANNWMSAGILGFCLSFFVGFFGLFAPIAMILPILTYSLFSSVYKLSPFHSIAMSIAIWIILCAI